MRMTRTSAALCLFGICVAGMVFCFSGCGSKSADPRTLLPAEPLILIETRDLGAALRAVTETNAFKGAARQVPDITPLDGVPLAIAVTGFETTEKAISDEGSELRFRPHFVAIAETHAWNFQAKAFAEDKLGGFVNELYGGELELETFPRFDGQFYIWTAKDGRKAYGLVIGSLIFFGNDESVIEKCVAVKKGEVPSAATDPKFAPSDGLAGGFVSREGVAQLAAILGLQIAQKAGEGSEVRSAIAGIVPQLIRNSVTGVTWTARKTDNGIEDKLRLDLEPETAKVLSETLKREGAIDTGVLDAEIRGIPKDIASVTRYSFKDPQVAWRSILLTARSQLTPGSGKLLADFGSLLFESYGIRDPESFLASIGPKDALKNILSVRLDPEGEEPLVIAAPAGSEPVIFKTLSEPLIQGPAADGSSSFVSKDEELAFVRNQDIFCLGSKRVSSMCRIDGSVKGPARAEYGILASSEAPIVTLTVEHGQAAGIAAVIAEAKEGFDEGITFSTTETSFDAAGIERRNTSTFGMIGAIIALLGNEDKE